MQRCLFVGVIGLNAGLLIKQQPGRNEALSGGVCSLESLASMPAHRSNSSRTVSLCPRNEAFSGGVVRWSFWPRCQPVGRAAAGPYPCVRATKLFPEVCSLEFFGLDANPSVEQQSDRVLVSVQRSFVRKCLFAGVFGLDANPSAEQQQPSHGLVSVPGSYMQRCPSVGILGIDVGPWVEQQPNHGLLSAQRSAAQRCLVERALGLDVGPSVERELGRCRVPAQGGNMQWPLFTGVLGLDRIGQVCVLVSRYM